MFPNTYAKKYFTEENQKYRVGLMILKFYCDDQNCRDQIAGISIICASYINPKRDLSSLMI